MADLALKNYMEDIVSNKMPSIVNSIDDICRCEMCEMDRMAYVLNHMPPKYIVTARGKLYTKLNLLEGQFDADIVRTVTEAIVAVDTNPRHSEEERTL